MSAYARHAPRRSVDSGHPRAPYPDEQYHGAHGDYATPNGGQNGGLDYSNEPDAFYDSYYDEAAPAGNDRTIQGSSHRQAAYFEDVRYASPNGQVPAYSEEPDSLPFDNLRVSDPVPRSGSAMGQSRPSPINGDPIPRSASAAPGSYRAPPPGSSFDPRNPRPPVGRDQTRSVHSVNSARTSGSGYDDAYSPYPSMPTINEPAPQQQPYAPNQNGYYPPPPPGPGYGRPGPQQTYMQPPPPQGGYNPLYNIASDVLGMPPGASGPPPPPPQGAFQQPYPSQAPYPPNPNQIPPPPSTYLSAGSSQRDNASISGFSMASGSSSARSVLERKDTMMPGPKPGMQRPMTKAIDVNQPPYTKEYIDQYRNRLKGDPDPETHFAFAKYLIEAAKKVGAGAKDQRAVRKYRDALIAESLKVVKRLATTGETYPDAQFFLANCYGTGVLGLEPDYDKAYHLYLQASKNNHAQASYRVAVCNELGAGTKRDLSRALAFYRKAAALGDTAAMYKLGMSLLMGSLGGQTAPKDALIWLRRAAEQADEDNPHALHELGLIYERAKNNGLVIPDDQYAKELFTQAAQLGHAPSQFKLGHCYEFGTLACAVDPKRSIAWYSRAAQKGDAEAELALSGWYLTGSEGVLDQSDTEAYLWAQKAARKGLDKAEYAVGYYTEMGIGAKADQEIARRWYMRAAAQRHPRAMNRLTEMKNGDNGKKGRARPTRQQANEEGCTIQ